MNALLIEVDYRTGQRANGIDPRDSDLQCYNWQCLDHEPGGDFELRKVEDSRDLSSHGGGNMILKDGSTTTDITSVLNLTDITDINGTLVLNQEEFEHAKMLFEEN